ncbi:MAG: twin-arginine translocase TatA/TatE family subunit [Candidatus Paracaedibacteraceae bacterium]|nr:twin-arginine translocase TatA/TatE family subunit [Candidatus Paracaedibacteraceae bacterium]
MGFSFGHLILLLIIVLVVFGVGKLPQVMGDLGKGIRAFKDGVKEGEKDDDTNKGDKA